MPIHDATQSSTWHERENSDLVQKILEIWLTGISFLRHQTNSDLQYLSKKFHKILQQISTQKLNANTIGKNFYETFIRFYFSAYLDYREEELSILRKFVRQVDQATNQLHQTLDGKKQMISGLIFNHASPFQENYTDEELDFVILSTIQTRFHDEFIFQMFQQMEGTFNDF